MASVEMPESSKEKYQSNKVTNDFMTRVVLQCMADQEALDLVKVGMKNSKQ